MKKERIIIIENSQTDINDKQENTKSVKKVTIYDKVESVWESIEYQASKEQKNKYSEWHKSITKKSAWQEMISKNKKREQMWYVKNKSEYKRS